MAGKKDFTRGAKKSLVYEVDQKVVMFMTPIVDGVRQEPVTYDNWQAAMDSANGGVDRALEANPKLTASIDQKRNYCIEAKLKRARNQRGEEAESARIAKKTADMAQENVVRFRNRAANVARQAKDEILEVGKDREGKKQSRAR